MKTNNSETVFLNKKIQLELRRIVKVVGVIILTTILIDIFLEGTVRWVNIRSWIFYSTYYGVSLHFVNGFLINKLNEWIPWDKKARQRAIVGVISQIFVSILVVFLLNIILNVFIFGNEWSSVWDMRMRGFYLVALIITVVISLFFHALYFFKAYENNKYRAELLEKEKLQSELSNLRAHLDPHFLFNSLNVLSGLIDENPKASQDFLASLSKMYRMLLEKQNEQLGTLAEELEIANLYMDLYRIRFENAIFMEVNIPKEHMQAKIPSLSLQILIENVLKHNAFSQENPMKIQITADASNLWVVNEKWEKKKLQQGTRQGLKNIQNRYKLLGINSFEVLNGVEKFQVKLPLINT